MISVHVILMTFRQQINPKENSVQSVMWPQLQYKIVKGKLTKFTLSITGMSAVNCQPCKTWLEQCSQLFCFELHKIHRSSLMEFLSSIVPKHHAAFGREWHNRRWRAVEMLQNGSIQLNIARQFNVSQSVISRLWNCHQQTGNVTNLPNSGHPCSTTQCQDNLQVTSALTD